MAKTGSTGSLISLSLDRNATVPLYHQILNGLRTAIADGQLPGGTRLPSTRLLACEWSVSRNSVVTVFETLANEGYLTSRVGDGTYVADNLPEENIRPTAVEPVRQSGGGHPFRRLSERGRLLIDQRVEGFSERPRPFMPDVPDLRAFPLRMWLRLMNETSGRLTGGILAEVDNAGYEPLRRAIAQHVRTARGVHCTSHQVIVTSGSQQSLDLICRFLLDRGDPVWIEEPGYIGARRSIAGNGCRVVPVPVDSGGIDLDYAARNLPAAKMIFVSPSRQYPLGFTMSVERRQQLIALSHKTGAWLLEDDYDSEFRYSGHSLPAIQSMDRSGRVIYIGTFSKTLLPSFRLGYVVVPPDLAEEFACARAAVDRHAPIIEQMVLAEFMDRGMFQAHIRRMRNLYRGRQQAMIGLLADELGVRLSGPAIETGMHLVVPLRPDADDCRIARSGGDGMIARPLSIYYAGRDKPKGLLFGFAAFTEAEIEERRGDLRRMGEGIVAAHA